MKHILLLLSIALIFSCSSDDDDSKIIEASEYGVLIQSDTGEEISGTYVFFNISNDEIFHQGTFNTSTDEIILFMVTEKEKNIALNCDIKVDNNKSSIMNAFFIIKNKDLYLNAENNPNATSVLELNPFNFLPVDDKFNYGNDLSRDEVFWIKDSDFRNN